MATFLVSCIFAYELNTWIYWYQETYIGPWQPSLMELFIVDTPQLFHIGRFTVILEKYLPCFEKSSTFISQAIVTDI